MYSYNNIRGNVQVPWTNYLKVPVVFTLFVAPPILEALCMDVILRSPRNNNFATTPMPNWASIPSNPKTSNLASIMGFNNLQDA